MSFIFIVSCVPLAIWLALIGARGGFWRVRFLPATRPLRRAPEVVAIVPARNEAEHIADCVAALLSQEYPGEFHLIVVDDHSTDGTAQIAATAASQCDGSGRFTLVSARELPAGWSGKVWAQAEGLALADTRFPHARYALLTDADIIHADSVLHRLVATSETEGRDLTSLMVRLRCVSLPERVLVPAFVFFFAMLYPFSWVNDRMRRTAAAAGGCMLVRRSALKRIGGIVAIRDALIDDCALAGKIKQGGAIRLDLADDSASLRCYPHWRDIWQMVARTAYTQLNHSGWLLLCMLVGMGATYIAPVALALWAPQQAWPAALAWLVMACSYAPMLHYYRQSRLWAIFLPLVALFYVGATLASALRYQQGVGGQWKGRAQAPSRR